MKVSPRGLAALAVKEGIVPGPYLDSVRVWTFGIGHTIHAGDPNPETMRRGMPEDLQPGVDLAIKTFAKDIAKYERDVAHAIKKPLLQHEFDALVSFHYNTGGIFRAKLTNRVNQGDPEAWRGFYGWLRPPEIRSRREAEVAMFRDGTYPQGHIPIYGVRTDGRLRGIVGHVSQQDFVDRLGSHMVSRRLSDVMRRGSERVGRGRARDKRKARFSLAAIFARLFGRNKG